MFSLLFVTNLYYNIYIVWENLIGEGGYFVGANEKTMVKYSKGNVIFASGKPVNQIAILINGTVRAISRHCQFILKSGSIIGLLDGQSEKYMYNYVAEDSVVAFIFEFDDVTSLRSVLAMGKEYRFISVTSANDQFNEVVSVNDGLADIVPKLTDFLQESYKRYIDLCTQCYIKPTVVNELCKLEQVPDNIVTDVTEQEYFRSLSNIPKEVREAFFGSSETVAYTHMLMVAKKSKEMFKVNKYLFDILNKQFPLLFAEGENNIFSLYSKLAMDIISNDGDAKSIVDQVTNIIKFIYECKEVLQEKCHIPLSINKTRINDVYNALQKKNTKAENNDHLLLSYTNEQMNKAISDLNNATAKILKYSQIDSEKADDFEMSVSAFRNLSDKYSADDESRKLRKKITNLFYEVYELVALRAIKEDYHNRLIDMFLNYGFVDERIMDKDSQLMLYYLPEINSDDKNIAIYSLRQWLEAIYKGKKEPSKNEFDLDYTENLRELKKTKHFTEEEERDYLNNPYEKVKYEISNMVKTNNKITNSMVSSFCPILKKDDFISDVNKMYISAEIIRKSLEEIVCVDPMAFHREYMYYDKEHGIDKAFLTVEVMPDIIIMPNVGKKGSMWQEIAGKKRTSKGRFMLPCFTVEDVSLIMVKLVGAFRWELCRTIQGVYWNDIREKSLTSEYSDYIQFYKKNRELNDTAREKIKMQLIKCRNSSREMFVKDYELWIRNESQGGVRLNKVCRMILFTYCPFSKEIRQKIAGQPMYLDAASKYERERQRKVKEITNRYSSIKNSKGEITPILQETLDFYENV